MPYIGRGTDKLSNVEVLDNITFDGSSSYTLQKGGSNFTPSSANNILISINGVVQAGNFTVSGSTIDFGTAVAGTSTCDFILHYGIGLITTPSDGTVTTAKLADSSVSLAKLTATGTKDATTFLRGDNTFAEAGGGLVFLGETSASNVASVNLNGYFTSDYDVYKIFMDGLYQPTYSAGDVVRMRVATTGSYTVDTGNNYYFASYTWTSSASNDNEDENGVYYTRISGSNGNTSTSAGSLELTVFDPMGSNYKTFTSLSVTNVGDVTTSRITMSSVTWKNTTAITGLNFYFGSANIYARKIRIYGVKNS